MKLTFNRQDELNRKHFEYVERTKPIGDAMVKVQESYLGSITPLTTSEAMLRDITEISNLLAESRGVIREIHYQIYGLKMEFI